MARQPLRLAGPAALTTSAATKYTAPSGSGSANRKAIVRHIHVSNTSAGALTFTCSIGTDAAGTRIFDGYTIAAGATLDHFCYYPLEPGDIVQAFGSGTALVLTIGGDEVLLG